jgi:predicted TIM-barrel fold metal-dependent hydrolase
MNSMKPTPLHFVWDYRDLDRAFWDEHLDPWLPPAIIDAHTHITDTALRLHPMTETMRQQYWVNEVFEPIDFAGADRCHSLVFPGRRLQCLAFGVPDLDFAIEAGNDYVIQGCAARNWPCLAVLLPQWSVAQVEKLLAQPQVIGVKPYYALISSNRETRDAHLEASIFDFLPHPILELLNDRRAWVTLHVPRADRLGHPDNIRELREIRRRYPKVILVIAHLGRCYTEPHASEAFPRLADDPGIFFDTSAVLNPAVHRLALEQFGPGRIIYGSDNPILYMRGRRQYRGRTYVNRTDHPFHFNCDREPPEVEAQYTLFMYEDLRAIKQACTDLGISDRAQIEAIFHSNAARLMDGARAEKS